MSNETKIAVIEGKWFKNQNVSVRSLFDMVSDIHFDTPHGYHYEMFNNGAALQEIMTRLASKDNIHNIYIAAHGSEGALYGSNEQEEITLAKVRNSIKKINESRGQLNSMYFGSCNFGNYSNLESLLLSGSIQLRWVAGYTEEVDFVKSSVLDALFWNLYITDKSETPLQKIKNVCKTLVDDAGGLVEQLGFKVLAYDGRSSNRVMELT
jgi:hypothetical protein